MQNLRINADIASGLLFVAFGGWFCGASVFGLNIGSAFRMGPGFFPAVVGGLLLLLGLLITVKGWRVGAQAVELSDAPWRAVVLIPVGLVLFGASMRPLGLLPALLILCICSALGVKGMTLMRAALLSAAITAVCICVFSLGLGLDLPLIGDWLR